MDTLETIICPSCGREMEKVFIPSEGLNIDICTEGCGGIFFDNREFEKFDEQHEDISIIEDKLKNKNFIQTIEEGTRICPACAAPMVKNTSGIHGDIIVDDCYVCGGKFLDYGEIQKIRNEYHSENSRSKAAMEFLYNEAGKELRKINEEYQKSKYNRNLAQKLFYSIMNLD